MSSTTFVDPDALLHHLLGELEQQPGTATRNISGKNVNMVRVVREFYREVPVPQGRTLFIRYAMVFLHRDFSADAVCRSPTGNEYTTAWQQLSGYQNKPWRTRERVLQCLARFGEHLLLKCIYPIMARPDRSTPSTGNTHNRSQHLRDDCLRRDRHRCVVTGKFDTSASIERMATGYLDDDGNPLPPNHWDFAYLQVAHIIPHALGWGQNSSSNAVLPRLNVLAILDMFAPNTLGPYHGTAIDSPKNAMTLFGETHRMFGDLQIYFEPIQGSQTSYRVEYVGTPTGPFQGFPQNVTFQNVTDVPLPDSNLLAIHRACARIAHATGAAEACVKFFRDLEEGTVQEDGSTPLDHLVTYRLDFHQNSETDQQEGSQPEQLGSGSHGSQGISVR